MILKKPYGLLIKNFRKIHLLMLLPMIYFAIKFANIIKFFNNFIEDGYITNIKNLTAEYLSPFIYIALVFIIVVTIAIIYLMYAKKKSIRFYIIALIYYVFCLIFIYVIYTFLMAIAVKTVEASAARTIRDIANIAYYGGYLIMIYTLVRGIGFDIKNFNFGEDLQDLDLSAEDSEEIELNINLDRYEIERKIRSFIRDTKYYIFENKFIFTIITIGVVLLSIISIFLNIKIYNQTYKLNKVFTYNIFKVNIKAAAIYKYNYQGEEIAPHKSYLVLTTEIENPTTVAKAIGRDDFALYIDNQTVLYPKLDRSGNFIDIAGAYYGGKFQPKTKNTICLVYELMASQVQNKYEIRLLTSTVRDKSILIGRYQKIKFKPEIKDETLVQETAKLKTKITFTNTPLLNTTLKINSYSLVDRYEYKYDYCLEEKCTPSIGLVNIDYAKNGPGILLVLDSELKLDKKADYANYKPESRNFYVDFMTLNYEYTNGKKYISRLINRTPINLKDKVVFQVNPEVTKAKKINLVIRVRDKEVTIKLK